jgi:hypothetical protein
VNLRAAACCSLRVWRCAARWPWWDTTGHSLVLLAPECRSRNLGPLGQCATAAIARYCTEEGTQLTIALLLSTCSCSDASVAVQPADSRVVVFNSVEAARQFWWVGPRALWRMHARHCRSQFVANSSHCLKVSDTAFAHSMLVVSELAAAGAGVCAGSRVVISTLVA